MHIYESYIDFLSKLLENRWIRMFVQRFLSLFIYSEETEWACSAVYQGQSSSSMHGLFSTHANIAPPQLKSFSLGSFPLQQHFFKRLRTLIKGSSSSWTLWSQRPDLILNTYFTFYLLVLFGTFRTKPNHMHSFLVWGNVCCDSCYRFRCIWVQYPAKLYALCRQCRPKQTY